jgi:hypothetical protein
MDDSNLDKYSLGKCHDLQHCKSIIPRKNLQGMMNNVVS